MKMALRFCANLSFMFQDAPSLLDRYRLASESGFRAVECAFPYDIPIPDLVRAREEACVQQILINAHPGDWSKGDRGLACLPKRSSEFKKSIDEAVTYANALKCKRIHVMAGVVEKESPENLSLYVERLRLAAETFEMNDVIGLIEPINKYAIPNYFLSSYGRALSVLRDIDSKHLKLQLDMFHLQHMCGNLTKMIDAILPLVGHIQIAQVPDRHEPDTPGEINYNYIFGLLEKLGYDGWIGLEYNPATTTNQGLKWIKDMGFTL